MYPRMAEEIEAAPEKKKRVNPWLLGATAAAFWPDILRASRWLLEIVGLGGSIDFILTRTDDPAWVADVMEWLTDPPAAVRVLSIVLAAFLVIRGERRRTDKLIADLVAKQASFVSEERLRQTETQLHMNHVERGHLGDKIGGYMSQLGKLRTDLEWADKIAVSAVQKAIRMERYLALAGIETDAKAGLKEAEQQFEQLKKFDEQNPNDDSFKALQWQRAAKSCLDMLGYAAGVLRSVGIADIEVGPAPNFDKNPFETAPGDEHFKSDSYRQKFRELHAQYQHAHGPLENAVRALHQERLRLANEMRAASVAEAKATRSKR